MARPIDTAPRNGEVIFVGDDHGTVAKAFWHDGPGSLGERRGAWVFAPASGIVAEICFTPTRWGETMDELSATDRQKGITMETRLQPALAAGNQMAAAPKLPMIEAMLVDAIERVHGLASHLEVHGDRVLGTTPENGSGGLTTAAPQPEGMIDRINMRIEDLNYALNRLAKQVDRNTQLA